MEQASKTIINAEGKILLYSIEDFYNRIVKGTDCFICGAEQGTKEFNDEHIFPDWLLRKYDLHDKSITLANAAKFKYGQYKVPCCKDCNLKLGELIETPVSQLIKLPHNEICKAVADDQKNIHLLFHWLMLVFFKTHLKDTEFNWHLDKRRGTEKIADIYEWEGMHHIHCMLRKHYTKAIVDTKTIGSIFILPAIEHASIEPFDYSDSIVGQSVMIRLDQFSIVCILNDSCAAYNILVDYISQIKGPLTPFQLREVLSHMVYINMSLKNRPTYYSTFRGNNEYHIIAKVPDTVELIDEKDRLISHGELLYYSVKDMLEYSVKDMPEPVENLEAILNEIKEGKRRYLFNDKDEFIDHSKDFE